MFDSVLVGTRDDFEFWLIDMDDAIATFRKHAPVLEGLDFTPESLDIVERFLLNQFEQVSAALRPSESKLVDMAARYIGETIRRNKGGQWDVNLINKKDVYYGLPIICSKKLKKTTPVCPHTLVTTCLDRRTGLFLRMVFNNIDQYS